MKTILTIAMTMLMSGQFVLAQNFADFETQITQVTKELLDVDAVLDQLRSAAADEQEKLSALNQLELLAPGMNENQETAVVRTLDYVIISRNEPGPVRARAIYVLGKLAGDFRLDANQDVALAALVKIAGENYMRDDVLTSFSWKSIALMLPKTRAEVLRSNNPRLLEVFLSGLKYYPEESASKTIVLHTFHSYLGSQALHSGYMGPNAMDNLGPIADELLRTSKRMQYSSSNPDFKIFLYRSMVRNWSGPQCLKPFRQSERI